MVTPPTLTTALPSLQRDPSETVSVKDVLARAAAKGLLDGVEVGKTLKRDKKRKKAKALPLKAQQVDLAHDHLSVAGTDNSAQVKITEFLHRESRASAAGKTPLPAKAVPQAGTSSQTRKPSKPLSTPLVRTARPGEKPGSLGRPRPEGRVIPLKPVEIILPPVTFPFSSPQGPKFQMPASHYYYRFVGSKVGVPSHLTSISRRKEKAKEAIPSSVVRHPRPWL